ncbi:MAG: glycosyltransferase family 4 protein [Desulfuromonadales bacterium]|nr:glycosyltransferase family 4 protein [Desulfuromonadales bacterium]
MTADTLGGVWDYALELSTQLSRRGIATVLATMGRLPDPEQRLAAAAVPGLILEPSDYRLEWMPEAGTDPDRAADWLLQLERRYTPDLIHLNSYLRPPRPWRTPSLLVAHSCVLSWWQAVHRQPAPPEWDRYATRVSQALQGASVVASPTRALRRCLVELYGPMRRSQVIWNGRPPEQFRPAAKGSYIFCAGRLWDEAKNLAALASVAPHLDWPVVAAGDWRRPEGGGKRPERIECLGQLGRAEMAQKLARAPIYALPARYEPFGLSILEAALCECALVLGDIPTLRELWSDAALFVPPDDHPRLRDTLQALVRDPPRRQALALAARQRARRYSAEKMGQNYCHLYADLLAKGAWSPAATGRPLFRPAVNFEKG